MNLCACGCGKEVTKKGNIYIKGHYAKANRDAMAYLGKTKKAVTPKVEEPKIDKTEYTESDNGLCACGCGQPVLTKGSKFRRGHSMRIASINEAVVEGRKETRKKLFAERKANFVGEPCACGCGQPVTKKGNKCISGHNRRINPIPEPTLCACGCGRETKVNRSSFNNKYYSVECMAKAFSKEKPEPQLCACGCGFYAEPGNLYVHGHNIVYCVPNGLEQSVINFNFEEVKFTGDGALWIKFNNGRTKNPDFIIKDSNKVIECADLTYWHSPEEMNEIIGLYKEIGIDCLLISYQEMKKNAEATYNKIHEFINS